MIGETPNVGALPADCYDMDAIGSIDPSATQAAQAVQAGQSSMAAGTTQTPSGLPPANLAREASANTVNAELVSSQWGIDPASVAGVYGGAAANGGLFAGDSLLPLLTTLTHANAEQALSLIGIQTPRPGSGSAGGTAAASTVATNAFQDQAALAQAQASSGSSVGVVVDPLWGRSA